jgi:hypothetical protein
MMACQDAMLRLAGDRYVFKLCYVQCSYLLACCCALLLCHCMRACLPLQVRQQNAELMAAFHRREQLAAVQEDPEGERSSRGAGSGAAGGALMGGTEGGSTPNTGSELGVSNTSCSHV